MKTYMIKWHGPYSDEELKNLDAVSGLYLITGYKKNMRSSGIQYCGITEKSFYKRLGDEHHKKQLVTRERQFWIGQIVSDKKTTRKDLELIERLIIYFWQPELNEKKRKTAPEQIVIVNRWYDQKGNIRRKIVHQAQQLHDVIFWDGEFWHISKGLQVFED